MRATATVAPGALRAAWATLSATDSVDDDTLATARDAVRAHGHQEIVRALVLLSGALSQLLAQHARAQDEDPIHLLLPAAVNRLRNTAELATAANLPTAAAVLTAGLLGDDAVAWWDRHAAADDDLTDLLVLTHLTAALRELLDGAHPGRAHTLLGELLDPPPPTT